MYVILGFICLCGAAAFMGLAVSAQRTEQKAAAANEAAAAKQGIAYTLVGWAEKTDEDAGDKGVIRIFLRHSNPVDDEKLIEIPFKRNGADLIVMAEDSKFGEVMDRWQAKSEPMMMLTSYEEKKLGDSSLSSVTGSIRYNGVEPSSEKTVH